MIQMIKPRPWNISCFAMDLQEASNQNGFVINSTNCTQMTFILAETYTIGQSARNGLYYSYATVFTILSLSTME